MGMAAHDQSDTMHEAEMKYPNLVRTSGGPQWPGRLRFHVLATGVHSARIPTMLANAERVLKIITPYRI